MHDGINNPAAVSFQLQLSLSMCDLFLPPIIKGLTIVASLLKINLNKYVFLEICLKFKIVIFRAHVNGHSLEVLYGCHLKQ